MGRNPRKNPAGTKSSAAAAAPAAALPSAPSPLVGAQTNAATATATSGQAAAGVLSPFEAGDWSKDEALRGRCTTMEGLFGDSHGVGRLIELSLGWFSDDNGGLDLDWYADADPVTKRGSIKSIEPSKLNRDLQEQTCEEYKHRLFMEGQPQSVAGRTEHITSMFACM